MGDYKLDVFLRGLGSWGIVPKTRRTESEDLAYQAALMQRALDVLGRKWALLVVRDIAFLQLRRFGEILHNNDGLTPRVLSRRLNELAKEGVIERVQDGDAVTYGPTEKGMDALYILFAFLRYGLRHLRRPGEPDEVGAPIG